MLKRTRSRISWELGEASPVASLVSPEKDVCPGSPRCLLTIKLPTPSYKTETGTHTCTVWFLSNKPLTNSRLATPGRRDGPRPAESARSSRRNLYMNICTATPASRPSSKQATTSKAPNSGSERGGGYVKFSDRIHPHLFCNLTRRRGFSERCSIGLERCCSRERRHCGARACAPPQQRLLRTADLLILPGYCRGRVTPSLALPAD